MILCIAFSTDYLHNLLRQPSKIQTKINKMRAENCEHNTNSLSDDLPVCNSTGTGTAAYQIYKNNGLQRELQQSYDYSFQYQKVADQT